jgi:hypothetical protein
LLKNEAAPAVLKPMASAASDKPSKEDPSLPYCAFTRK